VDIVSLRRLNNVQKMSKTKSNVHPGQYKIAGRERQGESGTARPE
jgi:hypothetical protein